jgi:PAS domain S-box-containing protein
MGMKRKTKIKRLRTTKAVNELELMFEAVTDLLSIHDQDFRIVRVNRAFAGAVGITPEKLIGRKCYEVIHNAKEPYLERMAR